MAATEFRIAYERYQLDEIWLTAEKRLPSATEETEFRIAYEWCQFDDIWITAEEQPSSATEVAARVASLRRGAEQGCIRHIQVWHRVMPECELLDLK